MAESFLHPTLDALIEVQDALVFDDLPRLIQDDPATGGEITAVFSPWDQTETGVARLDVFDLRGASQAAFFFAPLGGENPMQVTEIDDETMAWLQIPVLAQVAVARQGGVEFIDPTHGPRRVGMLAFRFTPERTLVTSADDDIVLDPMVGKYDDGFYLQADSDLRRLTPLNRILDVIHKAA